jgi:predicted RNase H-like HicB family nuclease
VDREKFETLEEALAEARERLEEIRREGGLPPISALRDFSPEQRVHARFELDGQGFLRGPKGGIDLMGGGSVVAYTGTIRKEPLAADSLDEAIERLRQALSA